MFREAVIKSVELNICPDGYGTVHLARSGKRGGGLLSFIGISSGQEIVPLSSCVGETKTWMTENLIKFNESKTYAIIVYSKLSRRKPATVPLSIGNASILPSDYVRNHGVIIDKHLSMEKHINNTRRVALYHLKKIAKVRKFLTLPAASQLISALVLLHIDYGNRYWLVYLPRISIVTNPASPAVKRVN